jgi:hypothetical protein
MGVGVIEKLKTKTGGSKRLTYQSHVKTRDVVKECNNVVFFSFKEPCLLLIDKVRGKQKTCI